MVTDLVNAGEELWYWFPKTRPETIISLALNPLIEGVFSPAVLDGRKD
jgi:hypothetical protein